MNIKIVRLMAIFGVVAPFLGLFMIVLSASFTSGWSFWAHPLSDLGSGEFGATLFNSGLAMTGSLMLLFSTGLFELTKRDTVGQIGSVLYLVISGIVVVLSLATIEVQPHHNYLATALFVLTPLTMMLFALYLWRKEMKTYAYLSAAAAILGVAAFAISGPVTGFKEAISLTGLGVWEIALGLWMRKQTDPYEEF
ncbi:MAG: DUF998 domain-containing protein [Candidatus Bathyarchaeota archaeon]|nr:DUF998 domain-containing protein [Candidatus Bathyarchaeota archaeon]